MAYTKTHACTSPEHAAENTGYTYSRSSSYSSSVLEYEREHCLPHSYESPRMSRRSLRLQAGAAHYGNESLLDSSLLHRGSAHSNAGSVSVLNQSKTVKGRRSKTTAVSGSSSMQKTQRKNQSSFSSASELQLHNNSSLSVGSAAQSDASLLSSLVDESWVQEQNTVNSFWGMEGESTLKDQTLLADRSFSPTNGDMNVAQNQTSSLHSSYICKDCTATHARQGDALVLDSTSKPCTSSSCTYSAYSSADGAAIASPLYTTVYSNKSRRHKPGLLSSFSEAFLCSSRKAAASIVCVFTLIVHSVLPKTRQRGKVLLSSLYNGCIWSCRKVSSSSAVFLKLLSRRAGLRVDGGGGGSSGGGANGGHSSYCGTMNMNELVTQKEHHNLNGPLCDDCKGKQTVTMRSASTCSSRFQQLVSALWFFVTFTGGGLLRAGRTLLSAGWFVIRKVLSLLCSAVLSPGKAALGAFWWLGTAWYQLVTFMSLLNVFFLTRCLPIFRKLLLFLLPFLLLFALWLWGLPGFWSVLPAVNLTGWMRDGLPLPAPVTKAGNEGRAAELPVYAPCPNSAEEVERLKRLEQSLAQLWERVSAASDGHKGQYQELLKLYGTLRDDVDARSDRDGLSLWVGTLVEDKIRLLREEMEKEEPQRPPQQKEESEAESEAQKRRLAEMEVLLRSLVIKTEELQRRQEAEATAPVSEKSDEASHAALLAEVHRLEEALGSIRAELQGVLACKGRCEQLDSLHDTVSVEVRQQLKSLLYGSEDRASALDSAPELPESLLQWLSTRFVSTSDLHASLVAMETSILDNLSLQMKQSREKPSEETVAQAVLQSTGQTGMSEENVQLIVKNALKLYSQDQIGLVDYALESGGGSVLSTRCSETYETKTALLSLFGVPLWYFSRSPRVVIQPDVHPGNCWAFRGSHGYLVIRLSVKIVPTAVSMEHIPKTLSPTGNINSAPRNFTVYGLEDEQQETGKILGQFVYQEDGEMLQTFPVTENNTEAFQVIELRVLSNWGNPEYTCLYRFRVHGQPAQE